MTESQLQSQFVAYIRTRYPQCIFTATSNGVCMGSTAKARAIRGAKAKREGVARGVPDILIFDRKPIQDKGKTKMMCGCAIELKTNTGTASYEQEVWIKHLNFLGWSAHICYGIDEAINVLNAYMSAT